MSMSSRGPGGNDLSRRVGSMASVQSRQSFHEGSRRARAASRARPVPISYDDAYFSALRVAFLNYLLQPRKKRKEYTAAPKPVPRAHTSSMGDLMKDFIPSGSASSIKLPHGFSKALDKRMSGVLQGIERLQGFNDAALKRTFAEAYNAFTKDFLKSIDKDRKVEPLILIFYSNATKAQGRNKAPEDHSWRLLVDRHLAMFVRLLASVTRDLAGDRDRAELINRLSTLENKLLTNDQNLFIAAAKEDHSFVEVEIPLSYELKDMPMVQVVAKIFGKSNSAVQQDLDTNMSAWTEEAALKDLKAYQFRLSSNMAGTLRKRDFDVDEAFEEWKRQEIPFLAKMFAEILSVRPDLKASTSGADKSLPARPPSMYNNDQTYAELGKMINSRDSVSFGFDPSLSFGSLSLEDSSSIRSVDEPNYVFIPPDPRAMYKVILQYAMSFDQLHSDPDADFAPLSEDTTELLVELAVRWRIPQFSRDVVFVEVSARKFLDQEMSHEQLYTCLDMVKEPRPEPKKPLPIQHYTTALSDIEHTRWTLADFGGYQQALKELNEALLRDLYDLLVRCYEDKPPSIGVVMALLRNHIVDDPTFSQRPEDAAERARELEAGLGRAAGLAYQSYLERTLPESQEEWDFSHVVKLGKTVVEQANKIKKRYQKNPVIMGASPHKVFVETIFPSFEEDIQEVIKRVMDVAKINDVELSVEDGFILYKELVEIRKIHVAMLPGKPFSFHIEGLLDEFVWKWIKSTEARMVEMVGNAIKEDPFKVRTSNPEGIASDDDRHSESIIDAFRIFRQSVEQIFDLHWDDDVHHARFMTALARGIATAIAHYCEVVEKEFLAEMERLVEQELAAAASRTAQEKFMHAAKGAWNTKDRIEPFQFLPEVRACPSSAGMEPC